VKDQKASCQSAPTPRPPNDCSGTTAHGSVTGITSTFFALSMALNAATARITRSKSPRALPSWPAR